MLTPDVNSLLEKLGMCIQTEATGFTLALWMTAVQRGPEIRSFHILGLWGLGSVCDLRQITVMGK